jgi:ABC-2 type transport system ATP-binding protein
VACVIGVEDLRKSYGHTAAVAGVSFEVEEGEVFGLLGRNGAGKTTTVECVQGLRHRDAGVVRVLGLDPGTQRAELRRRIGSQLQDSALPDRLRVWEALDLFASFGRKGARRDWQRLIDEWGLAGKERSPFGELSGGERQRLLVALALVNDPQVVFLDEMTAGLDPAARRAAWELVEALRDRGTTVVLVTHFMDEAERLCDRVLVMDGGRVVDVDTPEALVARHMPTTRVLFSTDNADLSWLRTVDGVSAVDRDGHRVTVTGTGPVLALTAAALVEHGLAPTDLRAERPSLEDVFLAMTESPGRS